MNEIDGFVYEGVRRAADTVSAAMRRVAETPPNPRKRGGATRPRRRASRPEVPNIPKIQTIGD